MKIKTVWGEQFDKSNPLPEYPRPQLKRDSFLNLNGSWDYAIRADGKEPSIYDGEIIVPYVPECQLSGVERAVTPNDTLFYRRYFTLTKDFLKSRVLLNFGAVDYICEVFINGKSVGGHRGGYNPFTLDITDFVKLGENEIRVHVTDPSDTGVQSRGKQALKPGGIWYTPSSGIWQTVWLESVPDTYIEKIKLTPDIDESTIKVKVIANNDFKEGLICLKDGDKVFISAKCQNNVEISLPIENAKLWSPESPFLYDVEITADNDKIESYFGMRKFGTGKDKEGKLRLFLNNKPYFHNGLLDQGYWCDGLYTPPADEAMIYDIKTMKDLGFNMLRKHIKVEPMRWYYYCDKLGMLVWQDAVNGGGKYDLGVIGAWPFLGIKLKDNHYKAFKRADEAGRKEYYKDLDEMVDALYNVVSISLWTIFNEAWGQFDSIRVYEHLKAMDPTRTIDPASGWHDQGGLDIVSKHCYFKPYKHKADKSRPVALSEFGGYSYQEKGHVWSNKVFGYRVYKNTEALNAGYKKLFENVIIPAFKAGNCANVYTQVTDVEDEINGIMTYDRKVLKYDADMLRELNRQFIIDD